VTLAPAPPVADAAPGRLQRLASPLAAGGIAAVGALALHVRDPHTAGSWGFCPVALLGLACPACGSLRAVNDLTHLDLSAAASSNLLLVLAVPVALALWGRRSSSPARSGWRSVSSWPPSRSPATCRPAPGSPPDRPRRAAGAVRPARPAR
jgi:hypothetical protein